MLRTAGCWVLGAGLLAASPAEAAPHMWGAGGHVSTMVIPGRYPITFPNKVDNYNFIDEEEPGGGDPNSDEPKRDLDANGDPLFHGLERVKNDVSFGGDFVYYIDKDNRIGALAQMGVGRRYFDMNIMARYDRVYANASEFELLVGGALGVGSMRFRGSGPEKLAVSYFPIRANLGGLYRTDTMAFQLSLFAQSSIPSNQTYTKFDGTVVESVGTAFSLFSYLSSGLEFTFMYGDFKPPRKGKGKGGKGKGKGKGGKGGGGGRR